MPSLEGLKTWFEYEILISAVLVAAVALFWGIERFVPFVDVPTLTPKLILYLAGFSLAALLFILWESGR